MSFLIDIAILVLLVGTLSYVWIVDRRVRVLMSALRDLEPMIGTFSAAVDKSESAVAALRTASEQAADARGRRQREPEVSRDAARGDAPSFRTTRERPTRPAGTASVSGKSELVRGFFETVRNREA